MLLPYVVLKDGLSFSDCEFKHDYFDFNRRYYPYRVALFLYFTAIKELKGQTIAVLSYIDLFQQ